MTPKPKNFKRYKYPYKMVNLVWDDAVSIDTGWMKSDEVDRWLLGEESNFVAEDVGFLIAEDESAIYLASAVFPETEKYNELLRGLRRRPRTWTFKKKVLK